MDPKEREKARARVLDGIASLESELRDTDHVYRRMSAAADDLYRDAAFWDTMDDRKRVRSRQARLGEALRSLREELAILDAAAEAERAADEVATGASPDPADPRQKPAEAVSPLDHAVQVAEKLMACAPEQAGSPAAELAADKRGDCAAFLETIASLYVRQARPQEAKPLLRLALDLLEGMREWAPFVPEHNVTEALCCSALALIAAIHEHDRKGAEKWSMRAIGILGDLQRDVREDPLVFEMLNRAQWNLYKALDGKTAPEEYKLQLRPLPENQRAPLPVEPGDVRGAKELLQTYVERAASSVRSRNPVRAMAILDRVLDLWERHLPDGARTCADELNMTLAIFLDAVGFMSFAENKSRLRAGMVQGAEVGRRLLALLPKNVECLTAAAWCLDGLGTVFQQDHRPRAAIRQHLAAIALLETEPDAAAHDPTAAALARVHAAVGSIYALALMEAASALPHARQCCAMRQVLWIRTPAADQINEFAESLGVVPALEAALGEHAAAAKTIQAETYLLERLREAAPNSAKVAAAAQRLRQAAGRP